MSAVPPLSSRIPLLIAIPSLSLLPIPHKPAPISNRFLPIQPRDAIILTFHYSMNSFADIASRSIASKIISLPLIEYSSLAILNSFAIPANPYLQLAVLSI